MFQVILSETFCFTSHYFNKWISLTWWSISDKDKECVHVEVHVHDLLIIVSDAVDLAYILQVLLFLDGALHELPNEGGTSHHLNLISLA